PPAAGRRTRRWPSAGASSSPAQRRSAPGGPGARPSGLARGSWRGSDLRHRERLLLLRPADEAAADALHADAGALNGAALVDLDALQVRLEGALAGAGHLAADAAQVLGLAAVGV